jgi:hypothetical protein
MAQPAEARRSLAADAKPRCSYFLLPALRGVCESALAAAAFSALVDLGLPSTLPAAEAALEPVCLVLANELTFFRPGVDGPPTPPSGRAGCGGGRDPSSRSKS